MSGYPGGHAGLLVAAITTHALVGYALATGVYGRPWAGVFGSVAVDADLLVPDAMGFPLAHRSLTHAPLVAVVFLAVILAYDRRLAGAVGVGYASHLLIDVTTSQGIPVAYPLSDTFVTVPLHGHSVAATFLLWGVSLTLLWYHRRGRWPAVWPTRTGG